MIPKPINKSIFIWLVLFCLSVLVLPQSLFGQVKTDSLNIFLKVKDSLVTISTAADSLKLKNNQNTDNQYFDNDLFQKMDSVFTANKQEILPPNKIADTISSKYKLGRVLPKKPELAPELNNLENGSSIRNNKIDVPKIKLDNLFGLNNIENGALQGYNGKLSKFKFKIEPSLKIKQEIDSFSLESIEEKAGGLAKNNITELQELDKMEGAANNARSQVKNLKWDKSKIKSSQNIAKVLSENVEAVQTGMEKMKDFKGKYSKVNLMNPNGPVLQEISKKPTKPWQFGLNFSSQFRNGLSLQLAPTVGYRLHEKWTGGVGISYQFKVFDQDSTFAFEPQQQFSHRIFNQINFYRNFFLHLEHELPYRQQYKNKEGPWHKLEAQKPKGWLGVALQYKLYRDIKGQTQILYNIIKPDGMDVSESRWTIRINLIF